MSNYGKFIFLDRDGVLNKKPKEGRYLSRVEDIEWKEGSLEGLAILNKKKYKTIVVTNQAGIGKGLVSKETVNDIHLNMSNKAKSFGGSLDYIYICPHRPEDGCSCRKPSVGLFLKAQKDLNLDFSNMYFIGDQDTDKEAANKLKINYINLEPNKKLSDIVKSI